MENTDLQAELQATFKSFKDANDRVLEEVKKYGQASEEAKATADKLNARLDEIETKLNRTKVSTGDEKATEAKRAFEAYLRKGVFGPEQAKALSVSDDTTGGFLAPSEYVADILKGVTEFSPIRQLARVRTTSARSIQFPKRTGQFSAAWAAETSTRAESTGLTYGLDEIPNHELVAKVIISNQDLEDSAFNLDAEIRAEASEQFAVAEGTAFVSGNAVGKPEGLLTNASISYSVGGGASAITADGLITTFYDLKDAYARNATWLMKRATVAAIRKLKGSDNNYLWQPGLQSGEPATILGRPLVEATDMPAVEANAYPILFGDFRRGYLIVDRLQVSVMRDPYGAAGTNQVIFWFRKRVGAQVVVPEAFKKLKVATS
jgi:HK97 family phage major capsid protein